MSQEGEAGAVSLARTNVRLVEVVAALSLATDLGLGQPFDQMLRTCLFAVRLGEAAGLPAADITEAYYVALLSMVGCTSSAHELPAVLGDEIAFYAHFGTGDAANPRDFLAALWRQIAGLESPWARWRFLGRVLRDMPRLDQRALTASHCEVAQQLAARLGFRSEILEVLGQVYERWDGSGTPRALREDQIRPSVRLSVVALDATRYYRLVGVEGTVALLRRRAGHKYSPVLIDRLGQAAPTLLADAPVVSIWEAVLDLEPEPRRYLADADLTVAAQAIGDFADLKSPFTVGHSRGVAHLTARAAQRCGFPPGEVALVEWTALVHDLGRVGVPNSIWDKPGALTDAEWERVRLHPYYTAHLAK